MDMERERERWQDRRDRREEKMRGWMDRGRLRKKPTDAPGSQSVVGEGGKKKKRGGASSWSGKRSFVSLHIVLYFWTGGLD